VAHSASSNPSGARRTTRTEEPSVGALVQSAMADVSTLIRSEIELAKAEIGKSAKKAGIGAGAFGAAAVLLAFSGIFLFVTIAEFLTWLGLERWISYLIVWLLLVVLAGIAALVGRSSLKKIEKPERTIETLRDLPEVIHREAPGQRRREVPTVSNGRVQLRGSENYTV
jgi:uncharacterized membrane protein YqjE